MKTKSIGIICKIFNKLNCLSLQKYYFECAMIFLNSMLRGYILYAADMYYNLKAFELRQTERIEEGYLREIFKTRKGCPQSQLYLESGHIPARFEIQRCPLYNSRIFLNKANQVSSVIFLGFSRRCLLRVIGYHSA